MKSEVDKFHIDKFEKVPTGLNILRSKVDKLDIGKLETTPADLSKLINVVKNDVGKKAEFHKLVKIFNASQITYTSNLFKKTDDNTNINEIEK